MMRDPVGFVPMTPSVCSASISDAGQPQKAAEDLAVVLAQRRRRPSDLPRSA